jgi:ribosomal-protein-alanine N-acetyltransferase
VRLVVEPMELEDIPQVLEVDRESYTLPWPASAYRREIVHNRNAHYLILRQLPDEDEQKTPHSEPDHKRLALSFLPWPLRPAGSQEERPGQIVGYAGMWIMVDEAHITTIAVRETWRGKGLGELLLASLIAAAAEAGAERVTLEVRVSNETAQNLYRKYGFRQEGLRRRYYSDNNEDAHIMTTASIRDVEYRQRFDDLVRALRRRVDREPEVEVVAPTLGSTESP